MNRETPETNDHDVQEIGNRFPELAITSLMEDAALRELETKYKLRLQIADQALRSRELALKEQTARIDKWANPLTVGVMVGALGLFGTFLNGLWSNLNQRAELANQHRVEQTRLQNDLIKEAIKPADEKERAKSLVFFAMNGLISLDSAALKSLVASAGSEQPVPGSSGTTSAGGPASLSYSEGIVARISRAPGVMYPTTATLPTKAANPAMRAIILHASYGPDAAISIMRNGRPPQIPGPLAHWAVQTDGTIELIAPETQRAFHVGQAGQGLTNSNTIGVEASGLRAFENERQVETLVRLVADIADRWEIPTEMILSHAEVAIPAGRKTDMSQQGPVIREMVAAVRAGSPNR